MNETVLQPPAAHSHKMIRTTCQIAMWAIVGIKTIWLVMAVAFVGLQWQVLLFGLALLILAAAAWSFGTGNRTMALGLAWLGVLLAIAVGYFGGAAPGPMTDRIHDQFRNHIADLIFLAVVHLQFWALGSTVPKPVLPANVG